MNIIERQRKATVYSSKELTADSVLIGMAVQRQKKELELEPNYQGHATTVSSQLSLRVIHCNSFKNHFTLI
jgi:hypothetical protein